MTEQAGDYYALLGVARDADAKAIKDAYHRLAMKWHPDRNKAPEAEERFKAIAKAYAVLSDPAKRARYDAGGAAGVAHFSDDELFRGVDLGSLFGDLGFGFGAGGASVFDRLFRQARAGRRGGDLRLHVQVPLQRIAVGGKETVRYAREVTCAKCHGHGTASGKPAPACRTCGGSGQRVVESGTRREKQGTVRVQRITSCPDCAGRGVVPGEPCAACAGKGRVARQETLRVTIPAGMEDGMALRVAGHGLPGAGPRATPGDLLVVVTSAPDARFRREGADLWRDETLDVPDAVLGTRLRVSTLDGEVDVQVPPGTQPDEVLRVKGKGLPRLDGRGRGDIKLRVHVRVPQQPTAAERELYERLRTTRGAGPAE